MLALSIARIGTAKRGASRIWLEGRRLQNAGFMPSARYQLTVDHDKRSITLRLASNGERLVSRKTRGDCDIPVVDLANHQIGRTFDGLESVKIRFDDGSVTITPTASDMRRLERMGRLRRRLDNGEKLSVGSVSTGLGVLALAMHEGLTQAGLQSDLKFAVDIEPAYLAQCERANPAWRKDTIPVEAPMQALAYDASALTALPPVDILEAGIPCTAHSLSGRAKKSLAKPEDDPNAGHLVAGFLAIAAAVNPAVIVVENVPQYLTSASFSILTNQLREWGYDVQSTVLKGEEFGCLEHRNRMAMVAVTEGIDFDIESIVKGYDKEPVLGDVLEQIANDSPLWSTMSYLREKEERDIAAGKGFRMQIFDGASSGVKVVGRGYAKRRSTEAKIRHPSDPSLLRQLTPVEHARVKGIPEAMIANVSVTRAHEMLGQSVLTKPFRALSELIGKTLIAWQKGIILPKTSRPSMPECPKQPFADLPLFA